MPPMPALPSVAPPPPAPPRVARFPTPIAPSLRNGLAAAPPAARRGLDLRAHTGDDEAESDIQVKGNPGSDWRNALAEWVEPRKYYPRAAIMAGQQGSVRLLIKVRRDGKVLSVRIDQGSGSAFLDQAWFGMFQGAMLPPFTPDARDEEVEFSALMRYRLIGRD